MKTVATVALMMLNALLFVLLLLMICPGCSWFKGEAKHAGANIVDCTTDKAQSAIRQFAPTVEQLVVNTVDAAGHADWNMIESATKDFAADVGGCVLAATVTRLLAEAHQSGVMSEPLAIDRAELAHRWDQLRLQRYGGALFKGAGP